MRARLFVFACILISMAGVVSGCKKPITETPPPAAQLHWLGKKRLAADTNAASLLAIWNLPESAALTDQTLAKLATVPERLWLTNARLGSSIAAPLFATNFISPLATSLHPLLGDLIQEESYWELTSPGPGEGELVGGVRLSEDRARLWETNLAQINQILGAMGRVDMVRRGDWTLVRWGRGPGELLAEFGERIGRCGTPVPGTNHCILVGGPSPSPTAGVEAVRSVSWLEAMVDAVRVSAALGCNWTLPTNLPRISLTITGDGKNVRTRAEVLFPHPLAMGLESWNIPTNVIGEPLGSFTAIRGLDSFFSSRRIAVNSTNFPRQLFFWGKAGMPFQMFVAAPSDAAPELLKLLSVDLVEKVNPWLADNAIGKLSPTTVGDGIIWVGVPFTTPYLASLTSNEKKYLIGGLVPHAFTNRTVPDALLHEVISRTNLVYYDWELTGLRIEAWTQAGQLARVVFQRAQLPPDSRAMAWLASMQTNLFNSVTAITLASPRQLNLARKSSIGLTAIEAHLLADWLESPDFPLNLHTFAVEPTFRFGKPTLPAKRKDPGSAGDLK